MIEFRRMRMLFALLVTLGLLSLAVACRGGDDDEEEEEGADAPATAGVPYKATGN